MARRLAVEEGLLVGISCGAAAHASRIVRPFALVCVCLLPVPIAALVPAFCSSQVISLGVNLLCA